MRTLYLVSPLLLLSNYRDQTVTSAAAAAAAANPFITRRATETASSIQQRPDWLNVNKDTLQNYLQQARQRHHDAVKTATEHYWSGPSLSSGEDLPNASTAATVPVTTHALTPPGSWRLPDFSDELGSTIFTTTQPLLTADDCNDLIQRAETYFQGAPWTTLPSGQYDVAGFWLKSIPSVHEWFNDQLKHRLLPLLQQQFPSFVESSMDDLCVDNAYLFKYTPETGRRTGVHTDSGCLSFAIAINAQDGYTGGGTWIEGINAPGGTIHMDQGHVTVRPGGVRHCGQAVESGTRYIIGGFCMHKRKIEYVRMLIGLGSQLAFQNKLHEAKDALECALYLNPQFDGAITHLADVLVQLGETDKAQQVLEYCLEQVNPRNGEVAYTLGLTYLKQENYFDAKKCLDICLNADDFDVDAMMAMAQICAGVGTADGEVSWYERIIKVPNASKENLASAYCNLGILKPDREIEYYKKALEAMPDNYQSRYSLGAAYASRQQWEVAAEQFRCAVSLAEDKILGLTSLYKVALNIVQTEMHDSQAAMMERMQQVMGKENYQLLAATNNVQR
jgi:tetratricopeptide (TPR) repeat protein